MEKHTYVLGVDIGGTNIRLGLVDEKNQLSGYRKIPQEEILQGEDTLKSLAEYLKQYLKDRAEGKEVVAIAAGIPAAMSRDRSTVWNAPNNQGTSAVKTCWKP